MRRSTSLLLAAGIIAGSLALAVFLVSLAPEPVSRELPSQAPFVTTAPAIAGSGAIPVRGAGTVRPSAEIAIAAQVGGRIEWVNPAFQSGGRIQAGQPMFRIEAENYVYRLREAEAMLADRQVAILEAEEEAAIARDEYERYTLRRQNPDSPTETEARPLALRQPQLDAARAALNRDEARVADAELALSRTRVDAPFNGFVREESVEVGQYVMAGEPVGRLFASDSAEVVVPLSDSEAALIPGLWELRAGDGDQRVAARAIAEYGDTRYAWDGYVDRAEASLDEQTRTIDVIVRVPDPFSAGVPLGPATGLNGTPPLLVGKFVEVEVQGLAPENYFRVRRAALQPGNEVWAVGDGGAVTIIPVRVLQRYEDEAFVTGALEDGEPLVTGGIQFAADGMIVRTGTTEGQ